jgi:Flp pilus assembly protein protease CpaA
VESIMLANPWSPYLLCLLLCSLACKVVVVVGVGHRRSRRATILMIKSLHTVMPDLSLL